MKALDVCEQAIQLVVFIGKKDMRVGLSQLGQDFYK